MIFLPQKLSDYLKRADVKIAALVGVVTSVLSDEQHGQSDWDSGSQEGTPGADFPIIDITQPVGTGDDHIHVSSTSGFTVGSTAHPATLGLTDGSAFEIVTYTGSTDTQFTGVVRGQYGTTTAAWSVGDYAAQINFSHGPAPDGISYELMSAKKHWTQSAVTGTPPSNRMGARMVYDFHNNLYWIFGGYDGTNYLNDLWKFDPTTDTWAQLSPTGGPPAARSDHGMTFSVGANYEVWIYGGRDASGPMDTVWKYDIATNAWSTNAAWNLPLARHSMCMAQAGVNTVYMTSGIKSAGYDDSTYRFNTMLPASGWTIRAPAPGHVIAGAGTWLDTNKIFMTVGWNGSAMVARAFSDAQNVWTTLAPPPAKRLYATLVYDDVNNLALMHGGYETGAGFTNLYSYDYLANAWTERCSFSREGRCRHAAAWSAADKELLAWGGAVNAVTPTWPAYANPMRFRWYWPTVYWRTQSLDLGAAPTENGQWILEDVVDTAKHLNGASYSAEYSDDDSNWTDIGAIQDGGEIAALHRHWRVHVTLTNSGKNDTARVSRIDALFDRVNFYSLASRPVGDYPPIVKTISALTSQVDPVKNTAKIGAISIELLNTGKQAEGVITKAFPRNKTVKLKLGVLEDDFAESDFSLVLKARVKDWSYNGATVTLETDDFLGDLKKDIPEEDSGGAITPLVYNETSGISNPVDIMLDMLRNQVNVADRDIDLDSFAAVKADPGLAGWKFNRTIGDPEDAYKLIEDICRHIGAALIPRENGKISLRMLKAAGDPVMEWNELDQGFKNASFSGEGDSFRNFVSTWWGWDGEGDNFTDYAGAEIAADADSITNWGRMTLRTMSKWLPDNTSPYAGDDLAAAISMRIMDMSKNGIPVVSLETNMSAFPVQVGDLIRVRSSVTRSLPEYLAWQRRHNPQRDLAFVDDTGRYSIPYLAHDCAECVDMKFWATKKTVDFVKGAIKWELARAREVPLSVEATSRDDFYLYGVGGEQVDADTTPGSVLIAIDTGSTYFPSGYIELVFDMGQQPERAGEWTFTDTKPDGTNVVYTAWASETGHFKGEQMPMGAVENGDAITLKARWYKVRATLTANVALDATPSVDSIKVKFANG